MAAALDYAALDPELRARVEARAIAEYVPASHAQFMELCGVPPSPAVRAIADAAQGYADMVPDQLSLSLFGCHRSELPTQRRRTVVVRAGRRGGKTSRLLATKAIHAALTVPLPILAAGEVATALIMAPNMDLASQTLSFVRGYISTVPALRSLAVDGISKSAEQPVGNAMSIKLRRPHDGKMVQIRIGAATRGGIAARGKTFVFIGLDEAAFFYADDGYTVNDAEIYRGAIAGIAPGGQIWIASTPWIQSVGLLEERIDRDWGKHELSLAAIAGTRLLNPAWDPDGEIERDLREQDPENAAREIDAIPLPAGTTMFFPLDALKSCIANDRCDALTRIDRMRHFAGVDLAFRKNSSALAIARNENGRMRICMLKELRPEKDNPLRPGRVVREFSADCKKYLVTSMRGDIIYADTAHEHLAEANDGVTYDEWAPTVEQQNQLFTDLRNLILDGPAKIEIPNHPRLIKQIREVTTRHTQGPSARVQIMIPKPRKMSFDQSHGDLLMATMLAVSQANDAVWSEIRPPSVTQGRGMRYGASRGFG